MKSNKVSVFNKRALTILTVLALILGIISQLPFLNKFVNNITANAAAPAYTASTIGDKFKDKMNTLDWVSVGAGSNNTQITKVNSAMWQETTLDKYSGINELEEKAYTYVNSSVKISEIASDVNTLADWDGWAEENKYDKNTNPNGWQEKTDSELGTYKTITVKTFSIKPPENNSGYDLSDTANYELKFDSVLGGYYREYKVSNADQLAYLLYCYQNSFSSNLKATKGIGQDIEDDSTDVAVNKLGVKLINDIDLNGSEYSWIGCRNINVYLDIDGQGHIIYNGNFSSLNNSTQSITEIRRYDDSENNKVISNMVKQTEYGYFLNCNRNTAIHDVTFSNMFIGHAYGMFGNSTINLYFNNINWEHCFAGATGGAAGSTSIVLGYGYYGCYFKDCTISNSYITGNSHSGLFASYNGGNIYSSEKSYIGDTSPEVTSYYYTDIPDTIEEVEMAWKGDKKLATFYPSIYQNCAVIDSEVYDIGGEHSGTFVSCMQSNIIFKNCFSNCTIYAQGKQGVFLGACIGSADGFYYPYNGQKILVSAYFEDCYTSGEIEGKSNIGGFVGMIFEDARAYNVNHSGEQATHNRGVTVFKNCYSTSSVGMQYSGNDVGGFVGRIRGNIQGDKSSYGGEACQHIFENCYAAGEVGGITTDTSTADANINSIGGFIGSYLNYNDSAYDETPDDSMLVPISEVNNTAKLINCYYDKQTTAMRERDIGNYKKYSLNDTLSGLIGVYTQKSTAKGVDGLTDLTAQKMGSEDVWINSPEYYPQLSGFFSYQNPQNYNGLSAAAQSMHENRAELYKNYALASTAAVLLDHYDTVLQTDGEFTEETDARNYNLVYDTVRDITRKFSFTTNDDHDVVWNTDSVKNEVSEFNTHMGSDGEGFTVDYECYNGTDETSSKKNVEKKHNPEVMKILRDQTDSNRYKCFEFAPGKQWVIVTAGNGELIGKRNLRLLPTAYLSAGGTININVVVDGESNQVDRNEYTYEGETLDGFNHYSGVAYAITDKNRMGDTDVYNKQILMQFSTGMNDKDSFVIYGGYLLDGDNTAVGLNENGKMYPQKFSVGQENNSSDGMTMIKVFRTQKQEILKNTFILVEGEEIDLNDPENLNKWNGNTRFDTDDTGYYYMKYYWRLNDGRYLTDYKLVKIKSSSHNVEIVTGILNKKHTVDDKAGSTDVKSPIDQYVTDSFYRNEISDENWDHLFVSQDENFSSANAEDYYDYYNKAKVYGEETYYIKSKKIISTKANSVVGWHRTSDYQLTTLIVEAFTPDGEWVEMARIDANSPTFDFSNAKYKYNFTGYTVTQDPNTKLFTVEESNTNTSIFSVENTSLLSGGIENYIKFDFTNSSEDVDYDSSDSIRVTALFRQNEADIQTDKSVLLNPESELTESHRTVIGTGGDSSTKTCYNSLSDADADYEVDNLGISGDSNKKAVLSGDILTYRMKIDNVGYYDSDVVNVYDDVPEGCEYIDNSMKIYRQKKDFSSGTTYYDNYEDYTDRDIIVEGESIGKCTTEYNNGKLAWRLPTVEIDYDYYVEYQVKVNQLSASAVKDTLTNTATYDFVMLNGDIDYNNQLIDMNTSITHYKKDAIFTMDISVEKTGGYATYEIGFEQNKLKTETQNCVIQSFENKLPVGFEFKDSTEPELYKDGVKVTDANIEIVTDADGNKSFTIANLTIDPDSKYTVHFIGNVPEISIDQEIYDYASLRYELNGQVKANSISKITRLTNTVETDVTHLYLNIDKTIEKADPSQTFLFRIDRYENSDMTGIPESFYTQIRCTDKQVDADDNVIGYHGSRLVQVDKRGYYKITEMTDWSDTDYDFSSAKGVEITVSGYPSAAVKNGSVSGESKTTSYVTYALPRLMYKSGAFPTSLGTLAAGTYPLAEFTNKDSDYAFISGQAYAENKIDKAI